MNKRKFEFEIDTPLRDLIYDCIQAEIDRCEREADELVNGGTTRVRIIQDAKAESRWMAGHAKVLKGVIETLKAGETAAPEQEVRSPTGRSTSWDRHREIIRKDIGRTSAMKDLPILLWYLDTVDGLGAWTVGVDLEWFSTGNQTGYYKRKPTKALLAEYEAMQQSDNPVSERWLKRKEILRQIVEQDSYDADKPILFWWLNKCVDIHQWDQMVELHWHPAKGDKTGYYRRAPRNNLIDMYVENEVE